MTTNEVPNTLEECHELIRRLQEENSQLRQAGSLFGQLAERLNHELQVERIRRSPSLTGASRAPRPRAGSE